MLNKNKELVNLIYNNIKNIFSDFKTATNTSSCGDLIKLKNCLNYIVYDLDRLNNLFVNIGTKKLLDKTIKRSPTNKISIKLKKIFNYFNTVEYNNYYFIFNEKKEYKKIYNYIANNFYLNNILFVVENNKYYIKYFDLKAYNKDLEYLLNNYYKPDNKFINIIDRLYNAHNHSSNNLNNESYYIKKISIGKALRIIAPKVKISEISNFIDNIRLILNEKPTGNYNFDIIEGYSIPYYYNVKNYIKEDEPQYDAFYNFIVGIMDKPTDTLNKSCMRHNTNSLAIEFYASFPNKIKLAILTNEENKLLGRCLIWYADNGKIYYDRIFYNKSEHFLEMSSKLRELDYINCSRSNEENYFKGTIIITLNNKNRIYFDTLPYFDTMKKIYVNKNNITNIILTNNNFSDDYKKEKDLIDYNESFYLNKSRFNNFTINNLFTYNNPLEHKKVIINDLISNKTLNTNDLSMMNYDYYRYNIKYIFDKKSFVVDNGSNITYNEKENKYIVNSTCKLDIIPYTSNSTNNKICYINKLTLCPTFIKKSETKHLIFSLYYNAYIDSDNAEYNHILKSIVYHQSQLNNIISHNTIKNRVEEVLKITK